MNEFYSHLYIIDKDLKGIALYFKRAKYKGEETILDTGTQFFTFISWYWIC